MRQFNIELIKHQNKSYTLNDIKDKNIRCNCIASTACILLATLAQLIIPDATLFNFDLAIEIQKVGMSFDFIEGFYFVID